MLLKALDFIRRLGWGIISFIYWLIDTLFYILKELNAYNIIDSVADNSMFSNFHTGIIAIAVTLLGLFALFKFVMKILTYSKAFVGLSDSSYKETKTFVSWSTTPVFSRYALNSSFLASIVFVWLAIYVMILIKLYYILLWKKK